MYELMPEMKLYLSNARYDFRRVALALRAAVFSAMAAAGVGDKILYGSDFPILSFPRYKKLLDASGASDEAELNFFPETPFLFSEKTTPFHRLDSCPHASAE